MKAIKPNSKEFRRKHRQTDFVHRDTEIQFVAGVIKNKVIIERVYLNVDSNVISSDNIKWIYDKVIDLYIQEGLLMNTSAFTATLDVESGKRKRLLALWKKIYGQRKKATLAGTISAMNMLKRNYDARNMSLCVSDLIENLSKATRGDMRSIEKAREALTFYSDFMAHKDVKVDLGEPVADYDRFKSRFKRIQKNPELIGGVPTGTKQMDRQMLGLREGEFGLCVGPTGSGKSIWLMNTIAYCWKTVGDSAAITIEMPKDQYLMRLYCYLSGITYESFRRYEITNEQWNRLDKTIEKVKKLPHKLHVIDMPEGCTALAVKTELQPLTRKGKLKLVGIDYMNIMAGPDGTISMDWQNQLAIAVALKLNVARGLGLPTWSLGQTDGKDDAAFSKHIRDQLDLGFLISPSESTETTGIVGIKWIKTRDFRGTSFELETNMDKMTFGPISEEKLRKYKRMNTKKERKIKT